MPDTRPDTPFISGVCQPCITYANRPAVDWAARKKELLALLDRFNGCVFVPSSGGKDSTYQVVRLLELGAKVIALTARTCHLTPQGRANIDNLSRLCPTIEIVPNMDDRAKLNRIGLETVGDISWPEHAAIFTQPFNMAADLSAGGHALLMYGECPQAEYGGPDGTQNARQMTKRWRAEFGGFLGMRPDDIDAVPMGMYRLTENTKDIEAHFLGYYEPWDSNRNATVAWTNGMRGDKPTEANWWELENLDNAQTGLHDYLMWRKYGYGRGCAQISVDVRQGKVTRENALRWVKDHDGLFPERYAGVEIDDVLDRIGINRGALAAIIDRFTNWDLFDAKDGVSAHRY